MTGTVLSAVDTVVTKSKLPSIFLVLKIEQFPLRIAMVTFIGFDTTAVSLSFKSK